jgi:hypothetical protein
MSVSQEVATKQGKLFSRADVASHAKEGDLWTVVRRSLCTFVPTLTAPQIDTKVYDLSRFVDVRIPLRPRRFLR